MRGKLLQRQHGRAADGLASMRPAHCAREVDAPAMINLLERIASMRPAHCAREVTGSTFRTGTSTTCFNEARALCAGSSTWSSRLPQASTRFNEARALCAGS